METVFLISIIMLTGATGLALGSLVGYALKRS
jgi:hypothetical protein